VPEAGLYAALPPGRQNKSPPSRRRRSLRTPDANPNQLVNTLLIINNGLFIFRRDNNGAIRTVIYRSDAAVSTLGADAGTGIADV
jgi:hypothetical protein